MDDGVESRANVYLPAEEGVYLVIMSMTTYGKGLPFCQGYADAWDVVIKAAPDAAQRASDGLRTTEMGASRMKGVTA